MISTNEFALQRSLFLILSRWMTPQEAASSINWIQISAWMGLFVSCSPGQCNAWISKVWRCSPLQVLATWRWSDSTVTTFWKAVDGISKSIALSNSFKVRNQHWHLAMVLVTIVRTFVGASRLQVFYTMRADLAVAVSCLLSNHIVEWWYLMGQDKTQCNQYKYKTNSQTADSCCTRYSEEFQAYPLSQRFLWNGQNFPQWSGSRLSQRVHHRKLEFQVTPRPVKLGWRAHPTAGIGSPPRFGCIWSWNGKQMQTLRAPCMNLQPRNWTMINFDKRCFAALNQWTEHSYIIHRPNANMPDSIYIYIYICAQRLGFARPCSVEVSHSQTNVDATSQNSYGKKPKRY